MSIRQVAGIIGCPGTEISRVEIDGYSMAIFTWDGTDTFFGNMNATFDNGKLTGKAQMGLR